ncbi:hypothetical protein CVT24_010763 [Panaeolus cyanescens]|uniref:NACHT domain-containing protein n=1 Tax=Panaeolus cyanescens TaxID=181874 RepID=A0A409YMA1_9AGAR|nr:hypothetical protein CVT24_010763 [Panaeolus cyanescens]
MSDPIPASDGFTVPTASLPEQHSSLQKVLFTGTVVQNAIASSHPNLDQTQLPNVIIVDGLDECGRDTQGSEGKEERQIMVLDLLHRLAMNTDLLPFAILVHSRPERQIKSWFTIAQHSTITSRITLNLSYSPDQDIAFFVKQSFLKILTDHPSRFLLPRNWPLEALGVNPLEHTDTCWPVVETLVKKSSGQFIFPATAMKFIASPRHLPDKRLDYILSPSNIPDGISFPGSPNAILDQLYHQILESISIDPCITQKLLHFNSIWHTISRSQRLLTGSIRPYELKCHYIVELLGVSMQDFEFWLEHMAPLLQKHTSISPISFHHASFLEFLEDPKRSQNWAVNLSNNPKLIVEIAARALKLFFSEYSMWEKVFFLVAFQTFYVYKSEYARDWNVSASTEFQNLADELVLFCDFANSKYRKHVMQFFESSNGIDWLWICFNTIAENTTILSYLSALGVSKGKQAPASA